MLEVKAGDRYWIVNPKGVEASRDTFTKEVTLQFTADIRYKELEQTRSHCTRADSPLQRGPAMPLH